MSNESFLSINDVSKQLEIPAHTLRYWEKQFPVSVKPVTGAGGRRYYRPETVAALGHIRTLLYDKGMTIAGVKKAIKDGGLVSEQPVSLNEPAHVVRPNSGTENIARAIEMLERAKAELV